MLCFTHESMCFICDNIDSKYDDKNEMRQQRKVWWRNLMLVANEVFMYGMQKEASVK